MVRVSFLATLGLLVLGSEATRFSNGFEDDIARVNKLLEHAPIIKERDAPAGYVAAPYYPTPRGGWVDGWKTSYAKAAILVANMTLAEKVNITSGTGFLMDRCTGNTGTALRLGFPSICLQDSALGVGRTDNATAFPAGITTGATFNKKLMLARGTAIGAEARGKGVNIQLGPAVGPLGRKPRGGRNWESFGVDPVLQAWGGSETIKGIQSQGVIATIKHWIGNEQEMYRMDLPIPHGVMKALSANINDRVLHELYAWPFAEGIRAGVGAVMTAYNDVNGSACSQNSYLINGILKDELGFQGLVMTDWFAQVTGVASALSGNDMAMPGDGMIPLLGFTYWASDLSRSVLNGSVPLDRLNDMVTRIVATWYQMGQDKNYPPPNFSANTADATGPCHPGALISPTCSTNEYVNVQADHKNIAREVAREGITVLKNTGNVLPLSTKASLKVFGSSAQNNPNGPNACEDRSCNVGVLGMGWGSGTANYPYLDSPIEALKRAAQNVTYYPSDSFPSNIPTPSISDVALVFITSDSGENSRTVEGNEGDRSRDGLYAWHGGDDLVKAAAAKFSTVIVIVHTVGPVILERWIDLPSVKGVVFAYLPGQEAGDSLTDILFGKFSPSGHLPFSIIKSEADYPDSLNLRGFELFQVQDTFSEGLYIDYRYLNKNNIQPRYAFGHGLSYTTFSKTGLVLKAVTAISAFPPARKAKGSVPAYSLAIPNPLEVSWPPGFNKVGRYLYPYIDDPLSQATTNKYPYPTGYTTTPKPSPRAGGAQGGNPSLWDIMFTLSLTVTNTGPVAGKDVVMVFISYPSSSQAKFETPIIQLRAFEKTATLQPGGKETVTLSLTRKDLSVWDVEVQDWRIPEGQYVFWVGNSTQGLTVGCESGTLRCVGGKVAPV